MTARAVEVQLPGLATSDVLATAGEFADQTSDPEDRAWAFDAVAAAAISVGDEEAAGRALLRAMNLRASNRVRRDVSSR